MLAILVAVRAPYVNLVRFVLQLVVVRVRIAMLGPILLKQALPSAHNAPLAPLKAIADPLDALIALPVGMPNRAVHFASFLLQ